MTELATTDSPEFSTEMLEDLHKELQELQQMLDEGFRYLKSACSRDGKLDAELMDEHQLASYELALCVAELAAARSLLKHSQSQFQVQTQTQNKNQADNSLLLSATLCFGAEAMKNVLQRLLANHTITGVSRERVLSNYRRPQLTRLLDLGQDSQTLSNLGARLAIENVERLASNLDTEKELVRETFFRFANDVVAPLAESIHRQDRDVPKEIIKTAAELGCFGTCIPERFGGLQPDDTPDSLGMIVVTEELSRGSLGAAGSLITRPEIAARALMAGGTDVQQQKWLPLLAAGDLLCAISITEPNTGSDVAAVALRANRTEGGWLLNGSKTWCTFAGQSELLVVLGRTDPDPSLGYKGLSLFLLQKPAYPGHSFKHEQEAGGILEGKAIATLGYRGMHSYDLFFEDYFVPAENLIGEAEGEGKGFYYTMAGFAGGRIQTAARAIGVMQAAYEKALSYSKERMVFGKSVASYQLTEIKLARMLATITASRQFSYEVAQMMDSGGGQMEASLAKLFTCRAAEWITREAMQIHGGMGYAEESDVSRYFVDARVLSIFEGAEEVLAMKVIARELMQKA